VLSVGYLVVIAALLQGTAMSFRFAPGQSHSAARAMFHRVVRGENVDEDDDPGAAAAVVANAATEDDDEEGDEARLLRNLFYHYDDYVFPGKPLQVSFGLSYQCASYDKTTHVLTSRVFERIVWKDERLVWNASDFGGIDSIRVRPWRIWIPDIQLYNEADYEGCKDWINALVLSTGTVIWFPPTTLRSFCRPTGKTSAQCHLQLGSWTYHTEYLTLASSKYTETEQFDLEEYIDDCPFSVSKVESKVIEIGVNKQYQYSTLDVKFNINAKD